MSAGKGYLGANPSLDVIWAAVLSVIKWSATNIPQFKMQAISVLRGFRYFKYSEIFTQCSVSEKKKNGKTKKKTEKKVVKLEKDHQCLSTNNHLETQNSF